MDPFVSYLTAYPGSAVLDIAKEKGYLIDGFDWDDLMIDHQQIETPEWSAQELRSLVEWEKIKTRLWYLLTSPVKIKRYYIIKIFVSPRSVYNYLKFVLSEVVTMMFRRLRLTD